MMIKLSDFIYELKTYTPNKELMMENGFSDLPPSILKGYNPEKKTGLQERDRDNLLITLFQNYNPEFFRFGDFSFFRDIKKISGLNAFCGSSATFLAFRDINGEILEYDFEETSVVNYCAKDGSSLLLALLKVFELNSLRFQGLADTDDNELNRNTLQKCVYLAGGNKYFNFYKQII